MTGRSRRGLRIAVVASNRHPIVQPFAGGLESHVWHLTRALHRDGHRVTLFAGAGSDPQLGTESPPVQTIRVSEAAAGDVSMPPRAFLADHHAYLELMMELVADDGRRFDVIHNHSLHYLPVAMAPSLTVPMLTTLHTPPTPWLESAVTVTGGAGSQFVAVSRHTADSWRHLLPAVDIISNGIDLTAWPLGSGGGDLIWFGRIVPEKGTHLAIEAARLAGRRLHLAGPVGDARYFRDAVAPRLSSQVRYHGHLRSGPLAALLGSCAAALVTPVWDEPYGLVVAEALACGTPVLAFARGGIPEIVDDSCGRLVEPGDTAAMANAVGAAARLPRQQVRRRAVEVCGHRRATDAYIRRYLELADAARAALA
ncbi:glycosyltransferase [Nocardia inohanensis]|uniref:glycosyltransferase n=1 Tax=Nocardia inohanensis TaxID=209246 RepID=UPI000A7A05ED|nr:glycosyltransferase [Nocardia inohanensis]